MENHEKYPRFGDASYFGGTRNIGTDINIVFSSRHAISICIFAFSVILFHIHRIFDISFYAFREV